MTTIRKCIFIILAAIMIGSEIYAAVPVMFRSSIPFETAAPEIKPKIPIAEAFAEFKNLSRKERKERVREVKKELKQYKKAKRAGQEPSTNQTLLIILAILLPPLAVYLHEGVINNKFWISLVLTLLFWLPGVIYALVVVLDKDN